MTSSALTTDPSTVANQTRSISVEDGKKATKEVIDGTMKVARSKLVMNTTISSEYIVCILDAGAPISPGLGIACRILIAKTFG